MAEMDLSELTAQLNQEMQQSIAYLDGELSSQRSRALQYYNGEAVGDLAIFDENRSKVVSHDVSDTVEWILPNLLKIFTSGDDVVRFEPQGPEDEQVAKQATEYCNWILMKDNPGFTILYTLLKDALIQKNGIAKVWWEVKETNETRSVEGMDDDTYTLLLDDPDVEIISHTEHAGEYGESGEGGEEGMEPEPLPSGGAVDPESPAALGAPGSLIGHNMAPTHDVEYRKKKEVGKTCIENVPPEEFLISPRAKTIQDAIYVGHRKRVTLSDLIAMGYDKDQVEEIQGEDALFDFNGEAVVRRENDIPDDIEMHAGQNKMVWFEETYMYIDFDGDGISELRKIDTVNTGKEILRKKGKPQNLPYEGLRPFVSLTPIIQCHKFFGLSIADIVMDIQTIKSVIMRQTLDNLYLTNNPRNVTSPYVNMDDYLDSRVGGAIRLLDGADPSYDHVRPLTVPFVAGQSLNVLEYLDEVKSNRTGVTAYNQGIDANSLNKTASGITQIMSASQQRIELIARIAAETGLTDLFRLILHTVSKYQQKERIIRLRGEWVPMDPQNWDTEFDTTITVGLGTGNKDQMLVHLQQILQMQIVAMQAGAPLVTWENIYNTASKIVENSGLKSAELYFTDPKQAQPQQPKPDPEMLKLQQQGEMDKAKLQLEVQKTQAQLQLEREKAQAQLQLEAQKAQAQQQIDLTKMAQQSEMDKVRMAQDFEVKKTAAQPQPNFVVGNDGIMNDLNAQVGKMQEPVNQVAQMVMQLAEQLQQAQASQAEINAALIQAINQPKVLNVSRGADGKIQQAIVQPVNGTLQ